ncbi:MAG: hypothetical protein Q9167_004089 [Letrouitia subvulpina]
MDRHSECPNLHAAKDDYPLLFWDQNTLVYFNQSWRSDDPPFNHWPLVVATQAVQALSIITACVPYLKPFFESLESGMIRSDDLRRQGIRTIDGYATPRSKWSPTPAPLGAPKPTKQSPRQEQDLDYISGLNGAAARHGVTTTIITASP